MSTVADLASRFVDPKDVAWQQTPYPGIEFKPLLVDKPSGIMTLLMRMAPGDAALAAKSRDMMERQLSHMVRLIDDLLDISRVSRNKLELRRSRVLLADAVSSAVETVRPAIEAAGHELSVSLPPEPVPCGSPPWITNPSMMRWKIVLL